MSLVQGKNIIVYIFDVTWKPYICATSCSLNISTEFIETSVSGTGLYATYLPTKNSFTGSIDGNVSLNDPDSLTLADLRSKQISQEIFLMQFQRTSDDGYVYTSQAMFFITGSSDTGSFNGINTFSITLQGTGSIIEGVEPPPPPIIGGRVAKEFLGYIIQEDGFFILTE
jgi:hypothetical protein